MQPASEYTSLFPHINTQTENIFNSNAHNILHYLCNPIGCFSVYIYMKAMMTPDTIYDKIKIYFPNLLRKNKKPKNTVIVITMGLNDSMNEIMGEKSIC